MRTRVIGLPSVMVNGGVCLINDGNNDQQILLSIYVLYLYLHMLYGTCEAHYMVYTVCTYNTRTVPGIGMYILYLVCV
jgi:hypothetical protein